MFLVISLAWLLLIPPHLGLVLNEIAGVAEVHHDLDFRSIATHLSLWEKDGASAHVSRKLVSLLATHKSSEILRLMSSLLKSAGSNLTMSSFLPASEPSVPLPYAGNAYLRYKRNIFGNIISSLTGLATEDEIKEQLRLDKEIRNRVTSLLSHQVSFEQGVAKSLEGLQAGEKDLASMLGALEATHQEDINAVVRLSVFLTVLDADLASLEDTATAVLSGAAPGRLAAAFSAHFGLQGLLMYKMLSIRPWSRGVQVHYLSYLYQPGDVLSSVLQPDGSYYLYTSLCCYHVHALQLELPALTEFEVILFIILLCIYLCVL